MFRLLLRLAGLLSFAGAFAALVIDGTRSLAASRVLLTPLSEIFTNRLGMLERGLYGLHPILWDPLATSILHLPLALVLSLIGLFLMIASRPPEPLIGYSDR
jgi:hypothetical protein